MKKNTKFIFLTIPLIIIIILIITLKLPTQTQTTIFENNSHQIQTYFCPKDNCQNILINLIEKSNKIDCAFFDLNLNNLTTALKNKNTRLVIDDNNKDKNNNLKFTRFDNDKQLSHNKFCIFDKKIILTGSFNPTFNGNFRNNNNIIIIHSKLLSKNYQKEFNELWKGDFGAGKQTQNKNIVLNNISIQNYFCPEDNCKQQVLTTLNQSNHSIHFMTFSFTDKDIANLLIKKHQQGIKVQGIMEKKRINMKYNVYKYINQHINITLDKNKYTMHHKVFIIDNKTVITGSYNPTKSGDTKNDENILIIDDKTIAQSFINEFKSLSSINSI